MRAISETTPETKHVRLTKTQEKYIRIIYLEEKEFGYARGCGISSALGVNRSTVALTLRVLRDMELISYKPYGPISMTDTGRNIGRNIATRHEAIISFLTDSLGLPAEDAESITNSFEKMLPESTIERIKLFSEYIDQHRDDLNEWIANRSENK